MGIRTLHDPAQGYAVLYSSTTGVPLPIQVFPDFDESGAFTGAEDVAERFLTDATAHFDGADLRGVHPENLRRYQAEWLKENAPGEEWSVKHG